MNGNQTIFVLTALSLLLAIGWNPYPGGLAAPEFQGTYRNGTVISLQGTPHLFIADSAGVLHWGGDTRALRGKFVDWNSRVEVPLATLRTLTRGNPYLTAGLLKDGEPIYLVKWETEESVPRLLHIQCIADVELFGINSANYLDFVIERADWETRQWEGTRLQVSSLQKAELPGGACPTGSPTVTVTTTPPARPEIPLNLSDVSPCNSALQRYGFSVSNVNRARVVTLALPPSVSASLPAIIAQTAPLTRAPTQTAAELMTVGRTTAIGFLRFTRPVDAGPPSGEEFAPNVVLAAGSHIVAVRGGPNPSTVLTACTPNAAEILIPGQTDVRRMAFRDVVEPQAIIIGNALGNNGFCYSWNRVQVCAPPSPRSSMTPAEQQTMNQVMNQAVSRLGAAGRLQASQINIAATLADVEGTEAVQMLRASMLAAPVNTAPGTPVTSLVVGAIHVDLTVAGIPGVPSIPPGDYAVRVTRTLAGGWEGQLTGVDGTQHPVPVTNLEVLGSPQRPDFAIVYGAFILPPPLDQFCFFGECTP